MAMLNNQMEILHFSSLHGDFSVENKTSMNRMNRTAFWLAGGSSHLASSLVHRQIAGLVALLPYAEFTGVN
jgi:hypothetical protein